MINTENDFLDFLAGMQDCQHIRPEYKKGVGLVFATWNEALDGYRESGKTYDVVETMSDIVDWLYEDVNEDVDFTEDCFVSLIGEIDSFKQKMMDAWSKRDCNIKIDSM